ncbi:MAG TPA: DNA/RNA helicase domain-containing protein [Chitinophagaceae bacterium]|nr:DNA/RNA helicase domain-containing protein [Chitinophagaceae bacterium]
MKQAYFHSSIEEFININDDEIIGKLNKAGTSFASQWTITTTSWDSSIQILKKSLAELIIINPSVKSWQILLEYEIPRLSSRIDIIIIAIDIIFVIEFKYDRKKYELADIRQVEDYANDLHDFHVESKGKIIAPILLAPLGKSAINDIGLNEKSFILKCSKSNSENFSNVVNNIYLQHHNDANLQIDDIKWEQSEYQPTPSIVQAAKALFAGQKVETITKSAAEEVNLETTTECLINAINKARENNKKIVCFVTGVPGAGKTLVGLNIVHEREKFGGEEFNTAYFSGNGPLINVLREALSRDDFERQTLLYKSRKITSRPTKRESEKKVKSKIQNLHQFIKDCIRKPTPPDERIVIFDEAQRCWDAKQFSNKAKQNRNREKNPFIIEEKSEAELLFEFMDRHEGWSAIIALVGGGQEINTGEAGIKEWGNALRLKHSHWEIYISPQLLSGDSSTAGQTLFDQTPNNLIIHENANFHLSVSRRSYRATNLNSCINGIIDNNPEDALFHANSIKKTYPLFITRDIAIAKEWLIEKKSGTKRIGLVASSGGLRLKPYGIHVKQLIDEALWFLNDETDIRSSYYLEIVATEYEVQGLELDWVGVCWDADLRRIDGKWDYKNFTGTEWNQIRALKEQQFLLNTYRVLLTRAREGLILFVPQGDPRDRTRLPEFYNSTFQYLKSCGFEEI